MDFKMGRHVGALLAISVHGFRALVALVLAPPFLALQKKLNDLADNPSTLIYRSVEGKTCVGPKRSFADGRAGGCGGICLGFFQHPQRKQQRGR